MRRPSRHGRFVIAYWLCLAMAVCLAPASALAHKPSDSYLTLAAQAQGRVAVEWHIALRDLNTELGLDADDDGRLTWKEVRTRWADIMQLAQPHLSLRQGRQNCLPDTAPNAAPLFDTHTDGRYAVLRWTAQCPMAAGQAWQGLTVDYRLFALTDPTHRGIVRLIAPASQPLGPDERGPTTTVVLGSQHPQYAWAWTEPARPSSDGASRWAWGATLWRFVQEGAHHIAIGTDHILFLLSLLLVSVWQRPQPAALWPLMAGWQARAQWRQALGEVLKLVTSFTVAHSITLGLAAMGVLSPPSQWVESLIAVSVLVAAVDNLVPLLRAPRWMVVFAFGLVHGFGFAGALQDLGLSQADLAVPLLGFNLGVELGQLALVAAAMPWMLLLRNTSGYRWVCVGGGSAGIAAMALIWLIERVGDTTLLAWSN